MDDASLTEMHQPSPLPCQIFFHLFSVNYQEFSFSLLSYTEISRKCSISPVFQQDFVIHEELRETLQYR